MAVSHSSRLGFFAVTLMAFATALPARSAEVDKFLPDDTEVVLSVNFRQILESTLVKKYALEFLKTGLKSNDQAQNVLDSLGFDPLNDITSLTVAGPGGDDPDQGLFIVHGKFDMAKFQAKAAEVAKNSDRLKVHKAGGYTLYEVEGAGGKGALDKPLFVALVDERTIVAAPAKDLVVVALDKHAGKKASAPKKELQALVAKVDDKQSMWLVALSSGLGKSALAADEKARELLGKFEALSSGLTVTGDLKLQIVFAAKNAGAAGDLEKEIAAGLEQARGGIAFIINARQELAPLKEVLDTLKVSTQGKDVTLKGQVTTEVIEKAMKLVK